MELARILVDYPSMETIAVSLLLLNNMFYELYDMKKNYYF